MQVHSRRFLDMFSQRCADRVLRIQALRSTNTESGNNAEALREILQGLHDIVGEASLLGLAPIVEAGRQVDQSLRELQRSGSLVAVQLGLTWIERISNAASQIASGASKQEHSDLTLIREEAARALSNPEAAENLAESRNEEETEAENEDFMHRRILVLDDSELTREALAAILEENGFEVDVARGLTEFDEKLKSFKPEMILTDIYMPEIQGDKVCRALKQDFQTADIPIILISGLPSDDLAELAKVAGADGWISKENGPEALIETLEQMLSEIIF